MSLTFAQLAFSGLPWFLSIAASLFADATASGKTGGVTPRSTHTDPD